MFNDLVKRPMALQEIFEVVLLRRENKGLLDDDDDEDDEDDEAGSTKDGTKEPQQKANKKPDQSMKNSMLVFRSLVLSTFLKGIMKVYQSAA